MHMYMQDKSISLNKISLPQLELAHFVSRRCALQHRKLLRDILNLDLRVHTRFMLNVSGKWALQYLFNLAC